MKQKIGELLTQYGIITQAQLKKALKMQKTSNKRLGEILMDLGYLHLKDLVWILSEQADIPYVDINIEMLDRNLINRFPQKVLTENNILPLYETDQDIFIAQGDPTDIESTAIIKKHTRKNIAVSGADPIKIKHILDRYLLAQNIKKTEEKHKKVNTIRIIAKNAQIEIQQANNHIQRINGAVDLYIKYPTKNNSTKKDKS